MGEMDITSSEVGDLTTVKTDYSVDTVSTEGVSEQKETEWMNTKWSQYFGYYTSIPELHAVIDAGANWTVGKGYKTDPETQTILDAVKGNGSDTFNSVLEDMQRTMDIGGDSYAQIIKDEDGDFLNLKPLDPEVMKHIINPQGHIIRFEQVSKFPGKKPKKFKPEEIFYLPRNRVADQSHGTALTEALEWIILAKNEAMADQKVAFHRFVVPRWIIKLDTDVPAETAAEKRKWDRANEKGENMYIPMGSVEVEQMAISPNSTLNPATWMQWLDDKFYEAANTPKIIVGGAGGFTEASVNIAYISFQQNIESKQLFMEEQIGIQLGMDIELEFPADLLQSTLSDRKKDGQPGTTQPSDIGVKQ